MNPPRHDTAQEILTALDKVAEHCRAKIAAAPDTEESLGWRGAYYVVRAVAHDHGVHLTGCAGGRTPPCPLCLPRCPDCNGLMRVERYPTDVCDVLICNDCQRVVTR